MGAVLVLLVLPRSPKLGLLVAALLAASMWFYVQYVLVPYQQADAAEHDRPRGNLSDLYPRWLGARELLLHHRDPYSREVTLEIQEGYYGRALDPARPGDPKDQQGFAYPVYVAFLLAPTVVLPFSAVQTGFGWLLLILTAASVLLWLRAMRWRPAVTTTAMLLILTLGSFPAVQGIKLQQLSLAVAGLMAGCTALLVSGHLLLAGVLLALATIKPQLSLPLAAWLLVWALGDWRRRHAFIWGFALTAVLLLGGAQYVLPGWIGRFRAAVAAYREYTGGAGSLLEVLITPTPGKLLAILVAIGAAVVCWRSRRAPAETAAFALVTSLVLAATVVVIPTFAPYNQLLLLPAIFLFVRHARTLWTRSHLSRMACGLAVLLIGWPWLSAVALTLASAVLPATTVQKAWAVPLYTSLAIPPVVLGLMALGFADLQAASQNGSVTNH